MSVLASQAFALFFASSALSLFAALALFTVSRTSPAFKGTQWLAAAYLAGAIASGLRMFPGAIPDSVFMYASNTMVLLVYVLLHWALLQILEPGGTFPNVGIAAVLIQAVVGPFLIHGTNAFQKRIWLMCFLLVSTLIQICYVVLRQGLPRRGRPPSTGMRAAGDSLVVVLFINILFSLVRGVLVGVLHPSVASVAVNRMVIANMVVTIVCAVGILLSFLWMTAENLQRELEIQARLDGLTGLLNRRALEQEFAREAERATRSKDQLALLLLDLDHFKFVNDLYGHHAGDLLLCEVARTIQQTLRRVDLVARIGGEEFVAILPDTTLSQAGVIAERLRQEIQASEVTVGHSQLSITASMGIAMWKGNGDQWEALLQRADAGMYAAKGSGRNRIQCVAS